VASARPSRRLRTWTRPSAAAAVAALGALALAGCSATNPIATQQVHNVTDGQQAVLSEDLAVQNLTVFTSGEGEAGTLVAALANKGREDLEVTIQAEGADAVSVDVPARGTVFLGGENGEEVELDSVAAAPGALLAIEFSSAQGGSVTIDAPVLDGTLPEYADLVPEGGSGA